MYTKPMIFPLDAEGLLYALEDEYGNHIATGARDVCESLLQLLTMRPLPHAPARNHIPHSHIELAYTKSRAYAPAMEE